MPSCGRLVSMSYHCDVPTRGVGLVQKVACSRRDIAEKGIRLALNKNHSLVYKSYPRNVLRTN
jgi:hypothetical protein